LRVVIQEAGYDELVVALRSGAIDVIFGALRSPPPFADLREESLFEDPYGIVCRRDHPLTRRSRPKIADLKRYSWVLPTPALPRRAVLEKLIATWSLSREVQIETNSLGALIADLAASDHLSLLPREADNGSADSRSDSQSHCQTSDRCKSTAIGKDELHLLVLRERPGGSRPEEPGANPEFRRRTAVRRPPLPARSAYRGSRQSKDIADASPNSGANCRRNRD
jgi:hypothetical protein